MTFKKYMHIEKWGNDAVQGIELGKTYIFPKLDGANSSLWNYKDNMRAGSRNREVTLDNDNQGFLNTIVDIRKKYYDMWAVHPHLRLYGEWMVPHTLKTYRDDVWRKFWVFDVYNDETESYMTYDAYKPILAEFDIDYIAPLGIIKNGNYENFLHLLKQNNHFIKDGEGLGEGVVIKNYEFINRFGNQVWAKIISSEFKEKHHKEMGPPETETQLLEEKLVNEACTEALCMKVQAKIMNDRDGWNSRYIPELLERVYYDIINEELWDFVKKNRNATINFATLRHFTTAKIKENLPEVF